VDELGKLGTFRLGAVANSSYDCGLVGSPLFCCVSVLWGNPVMMRVSQVSLFLLRSLKYWYEMWVVEVDWTERRDLVA
jgi:hypothetical protein